YQPGDGAQLVKYGQPQPGRVVLPGSRCLQPRQYAWSDHRPAVSWTGHAAIQYSHESIATKTSCLISSLELAEKTQISTVEQADIIHAGTHHDKAVQTNIDVESRPDQGV